LELFNQNGELAGKGFCLLVELTRRLSPVFRQILAGIVAGFAIVPRARQPILKAKQA